LSMVSKAAAVFEISLGSWDPLFWRASHELVPRGEIVDRAKLVPDTRFVWVRSRCAHEFGRIRVIDAQRRRTTREIEDIWAFEWIVDAHGSRMVCSGARDRVTLYDMRGAPTQDRIVFSTASVNHAVVHPSGQGLLVGSGIDDEMVEFEEIGCAPNPWGHKWSGSTEAYRTSTLVTSLRRRNAYFMAVEQADRVVFDEMGFVEGGLRKRSQGTFSAKPFIVQDAGHQNALALFQDGQCVHLVPLSEQIPVVPAIRRSSIYVPNPFSDFGCGFPDGRGGETLLFIETLQRVAPANQIEHLHGFAATMLHKPVDLFDTHRVLVSAKKPKLAAALLAWMQQVAPSNLYTVMIMALDALQRGSLTEAIQLFEPLRLDTIAASHRPHVCHEFALALIHAGEIERAISVLTEGLRAGQSDCNLQDLLDLIQPLADDLADSNRPILLRIRYAIQKYDACAEQGDVRGAHEAIDVLDIWEVGEVQALARLATAYLQCDPQDDAQKFRKALALAKFIGEHQTLGSLRNEFIVDAARWPKSKLDEVEVRAAQWLETLA